MKGLRAPPGQEWALSRGRQHTQAQRPLPPATGLLKGLFISVWTTPLAASKAVCGKACFPQTRKVQARSTRIPLVI